MSAATTLATLIVAALAAVVGCAVLRALAALSVPADAYQSDGVRALGPGDDGLREDAADGLPYSIHAGAMPDA